ncbi:TRAP transporter small permease [Alkalihalobacterium elongatum]|uniref:TRAP transporter small permease n=1 Tax=Alkalihalobacterium elongatum TaxID=2675466 RepID=UPI001C1F6D8A|nr:TRAP transporter small permease [Alkalihalobacterium elongatum]
MLEQLDKNLERVSNTLNHYSKIALGVIVGSMFLAVILQVALRYMFNTGLNWPEEFTTFLMAWMTFLGSAIALKQLEHINIDMFVEKLSIRGQEILRFITKLLMLAFIILLTYVGFRFALNSMNFTSNALGIPLFWPRLSVAFAGALMIIHMLHFIVRDLREVIIK